MRELFRSRVRGQALSELQGAIIVGAIVIGAIVYLLGRQVALAMSSHNYDLSTAATVSLFKDLDRNGASAQAVFEPAADVADASNADGHEIDFYQMNDQHVGHFWALCYKTASGDCQGLQTVGTLQTYTYLWAQLPQNGGSGATMQSEPVTDFTAFRFAILDTPAQYADATQDPAAAYFQKHAANFASARTYHWGYPGVSSSTNDLYVVTVTMPDGEQRAHAFGKHHIVFAQEVLYGTATPTPNPICENATCPSGATLTFRNPLDGAQTATITENNYGTRATSPAQVYTFAPGACADTGASGYAVGHADATYAPNGTVTPTGDGTGTATVAVTPVVQALPLGPATCQFAATDNAGQVSTIPAQIGQTYSPTATGATITFSTNATTPIFVSERNYDIAPTGGMSAAITSNAAGACSGVSFGSSGLSSDGTYTDNESWTLSFAKPGACQLTFTDRYGQTADATATANPAPLIVWPAAIQLPVSPSSSLGAIAYDASRDRSAGSLLNRILGGGIAMAAGVGACPAGYARAFATANFSDPTQVLASTTYGIIVTDSNGCYNPAMALLVASQAGYTGVFTFGDISCNGFVQFGLWSATVNGGATAPGAGQAAKSACTFDVTSTDHLSPASGAPVTTAQVVSPCAQIGNTCTFTAAPWPNDNPSCYWASGNDSGIFPGYSGNGVYSLSSPPINLFRLTTSDAYGYLTNNGDGSVTFTRTALGADTVYAYAIYDNFNFISGPMGKMSCKMSQQGQLDGSWSV
jgi:hypothetical protein